MPNQAFNSWLGDEKERKETKETKERQEREMLRRATRKQIKVDSFGQDLVLVKTFCSKQSLYFLILKKILKQDKRILLKKFKIKWCNFK